MRTIKFRVWDKKNKEMSGIVGFSGMDYSVENEFNYVVCKSVVQVKDAEIMQFTGLLDKNGKEIYEGDIVKQKMGNRKLIGIMKFDETRATFGFDAEIESKYEVPEHLILNSKPEVIGNIYENPELLKINQ